MGTTNLSAEKSLQLITEMIEKSRRDFERNSGNPMIIWGSVVLVFAIAVWFMISRTSNPYWNYLWFGIPVAGYLIEFIVRRNRKNEKKAVNFINSTIGKIWIFYGLISVLTALVLVFSDRFAGLITPLVVLLLGFSTALTGAIIKNTAITAGGVITAVGGSYLYLAGGLDASLVIGTAAVVALIIPGIMINIKTHKTCKSSRN